MEQSKLKQDFTRLEEDHLELFLASQGIYSRTKAALIDDVRKYCSSKEHRGLSTQLFPTAVTLVLAQPFTERVWVNAFFGAGAIKARDLEWEQGLARIGENYGLDISLPDWAYSSNL